MTAIYIPIIQAEVVMYIELWNKHVIRKQRERPNLVSGKLIFNYFYSYTKGVPNCGYQVDPELLERIQADTAH